MAKYGRAPGRARDIAGDDADHRAEPTREAREKLAKLQSWLTPTNALARVAAASATTCPAMISTRRCPPPPTQGGRTFTTVLYEMAKRENMTLRDLYNLTAAARGHWVVCGTPKRIADTLEEWFAGAGRRVRVCRRISRARSTISSIVCPGIAAPRPVPARLFRPNAAASSRAGDAVQEGTGGLVA